MKEQTNAKKLTFTAVLVCGLIAGMMVMVQVLPNQLGIPGWHTIASAADSNPGTGASGVLDIFVYPHQATPGTAYAANLSAGAAYAERNTLNGACSGNVPYATAFDLVIKCRYNATHAYNTTGSLWMLSWTQGLITCANLGIGADTTMSVVKIGSNATYLWVNFYINNGGSGYTITHGQVVNVTSFKMQAYY